MTDPKVLTVDSSNWETIDYPESSRGSASINHHIYDKEYYLMEGVAGWEVCHIPDPITITELRINDEVVMIDDPMHWMGMEGLAKACSGRVLIGGLGLGLILHHIVNNPNVTSVDVVEINKDVIELIAPLLPNDERVNIILGDIFAYKWVHGNYDTIVLDIWVKHDAETKIAGLGEGPGIYSTVLRFQFNNPDTKVFVWGHRNPKLNPAVEPVSKEYMRWMKEMAEEDE